MMKSLVLGALLGGLAVFVWSWISWVALPWHNATIRSFTDEDAVARVLVENLSTEGMVQLPGLPPGYETMTADQKKAADAAMTEKMKSSPFVFGVVRRQVQSDMGRSMGYALLFDVLAALLVTMLVMKTGGMTWGGRVMFIVTVALAVGVIAVLPHWVWWHYPAGYVLLTMADLLVGWLLAGMVIASVARPKAA